MLYIVYFSPRNSRIYVTCLFPGCIGDSVLCVEAISCFFNGESQHLTLGAGFSQLIISIYRRVRVRKVGGLLFSFFLVLFFLIFIFGFWFLVLVFGFGFWF